MGSDFIPTLQALIGAAMQGLAIELVWRALLHGHKETRHIMIDGRRYIIEGRLCPVPHIVMTKI